MALKYLNALDEDTIDVEQKDWRGGADEFGTATDLPDNVGGRLINCIVEDNGRPRTRPGADALGGSSLSAGNKIQALTYFDTPSLEYVFASINQTLRRWNGTVWDTPAGYPFGANSILEMAQGANVLYASIGSGQWFSFDGTTWSAGLGTDNSAAAGDPPTGATIMCWHTNRMFAAGTLASGFYDELVASFIGAAGANSWDWTNFSLRIGRGEGEAIRALCPAKGQWLAIGKEGSIYMAYTSPLETSAANWPVDRLAGSVGVVSKRALISAGDSLWCVGPDLALREIVPLQRQEDVPFELGPVASEAAKPYMDRINTGQLSKIALGKYGRYLMLALPLDSATEPSHVLVWNLRLRKPSMSGPGTVPAFIGVWTGWTPTVFAVSRFAGAERLLIGDSDGKVNMFKDRSDQTDEDTFADNDTDVLATQRTKSWDFGGRRNWKDAESAELQWANSTPQVDIVAVLDEEEQKRRTVSLETIQNQLPVNLPFDLAVVGPSTATWALDELPEFKEAYIQVEQLTRGRVELKSVAMSAFVNTTSQE